MYKSVAEPIQIDPMWRVASIVLDRDQMSAAEDGCEAILHIMFVY